MRLRERDREEREARPAEAGAASEAADLAAARERARRLLDAADDAIGRALSSDSARFLEQNRQQGGQ